MPPALNGYMCYYHNHVKGHGLFEQGPTWEILIVLFNFSSVTAARIYYSGLTEYVECQRSRLNEGETISVIQYLEDDCLYASG